MLMPSPFVLKLHFRLICSALPKFLTPLFQIALLAFVAAVAAESPLVRTGYGPAPAVRAAAPRPLVRILESESQSDDQGGYRFRFLSEDETARQEEAAAGAVTGSYSYVAPDGTEVSVRYVADALGFRAESDALPTPVPTEYPTPAVPSTEAAPAVRTGAAVQEYRSTAAEEREPEPRTAPEPAVRYEPVYAYRAVSQ